MNDKTTIVIKQIGTQASTDPHQNIEHVVHEKLNRISAKNPQNKITCTIIDHFMNDNYEYFVFEKLGVSLQHLLTQGQGNLKFDLNTVCTIFDNMIVSLYKLHENGFIHNDIKLENILIGDDYNSNLDKLYLIDFGISSEYYNFKKSTHKPVEYDVPFKGTFRFSSQNHHCGKISQSRRDDLESLIYMCIFCLTNQLPWICDPSTCKTKKEIFDKSQKIKSTTSIDDICYNVPDEFKTALDYVKKLQYDEMPDYKYLQQLFQTLHSKVFAVCIDWNVYDLTSQNVGMIHFLGCHTKERSRKDELHDKLNEIDFYNDNNPEEEKKAERIESATATSDKKSNQSISTSLDPITNNIQKKNRQMIANYNNQMDKRNSTMTNLMFQTQLTVHNNQIQLKNRFGFIINAVTMKDGVPQSESQFKHDYSGIIIYEQIGDKKIDGNVYMLDVEKCKQVKKDYKKNNHNKKLNGTIHGAVYYHYFKQNIHLCNEKESIYERKLIRGFSLEKNGTFKFRSGAFNLKNFKLRDSKYKDLVIWEKQFLKFAIKQYWTNNIKHKHVTFKEFQANNMRVDVKDEKSNDANTERNHDGNINNNDCNDDTKVDGLLVCVSQYNATTDIHLNDSQKSKKVKLSWNVVADILQYLTIEDQLNLFRTSKLSQFSINKSCFNCNRENDWIYIVHLKNINSNDANNNSNGLNVSYVDKQMIDQSRINFDNLSYIDSNNRLYFLLLSNHPIIHLVHKNGPTNSFKNIAHVLHVIHKCNTLIGKNSSLIDCHVDGSSQWSWRNSDQWINYSKISNMIIENGYLEGKVNYVMIQSYHARTKIFKNYKILFEKESTRICQTKINLKSRNNILNPIYNRQNIKGKDHEKSDLKYFLQQNVERRAYRIVRRKAIKSSAKI